METSFKKRGVRMKKLLLFLLCAAFDHAYTTTKLKLKDNSVHEVAKNFINENDLLKNMIADIKDDDSIVSVPNDFVTHATLQQLETFTGRNKETVTARAQGLAPETLANTLLAADFLGSKHTDTLTTVLAKKLLRNKALPGISHLFETLETVKGKQGIKEIHNDAVRRNLVDEILKNELPLKLLHILKGHAGFVNSAQFSPDGTQIVTASNDNTARLWSATTGELLRTLEGHAHWVLSAQFSPNGTQIVTASADRTAKLWNAITGELLRTLEGHTNSVLSAQFSPDGTQIITASADNTAKLWNTTTGELLRTIQGHAGGVFSAQFSPNGTQIVTASWDRTAKLWNAITGELLRTIQGHAEGVFSAQFSPDGTQIVTVCHDRTAKLWNAITGELLRTLEGHAGGVQSAQFSPNGTQIVTTCDDNTTKLWNATTGECIKTVQGHTSFVLYTQFSPDGTQIVTAGSDHTSRIFSLITAKTIKAYGWDLYSVPLAQVIDWAQTGTIEKAPVSLNEQPVSPEEPTSAWNRIKNLWNGVVTGLEGN